MYVAWKFKRILYSTLLNNTNAEENERRSDMTMEEVLGSKGIQTFGETMISECNLYTF